MNKKRQETMKNLFIIIAIVFTGFVPVYGQPKFNIDDVKYVIFTSDKEAEGTREGIYKYTSKEKSDTHKSPPIRFRFVSQTRGILGIAICYKHDFDKLAKIRKVAEKDKRVIKEDTDAFLNSVDLMDMDILFPKMTKEEFIKIWNGLSGKNVYFIDRSEIKNKKVKLYPVNLAGINLY